MVDLLHQGCDLMIVIGGFNSSNTTHLVEIASRSLRAYHVEDADNLISPRWIRHKPLEEQGPVVEEGWLPEGPLVIGLTAGASTPDSEIGRSVARLLSFRGVPEETIEHLAASGRKLAELRRREGDRSAGPSGDA